MNHHTVLNMSPERQAGILNLTFKDKLLISFQIFKARGPICFLIILASTAFLTLSNTFISLLGLKFPIASLLILPADIIDLMLTIGICASILRYMDGLEPKLHAYTFVKPFKYTIKLLPLMPILLIPLLAVHSDLLPGMSKGAFMTLAALTSLVWFVIVYYYLYIAENPQANLGKMLKIPFSLIITAPKAWLSALLASLLIYLLLGAIFALFLVGLHLIDPGMDIAGIFLDHNFQFTTIAGPIAFIIGLFVFICLLLIMSTYFFFLFAVAYKQAFLIFALLERDRHLKPGSKT